MLGSLLSRRSPSTQPAAADAKKEVQGESNPKSPAEGTGAPAEKDPQGPGASDSFQGVPAEPSALRAHRLQHPEAEWKVLFVNPAGQAISVLADNTLPVYDTPEEAKGEAPAQQVPPQKKHTGWKGRLVFLAVAVALVRFFKRQGKSSTEIPPAPSEPRALSPGTSGCGPAPSSGVDSGERSQGSE